MAPASRYPIVNVRLINYVREAERPEKRLPRESFPRRAFHTRSHFFFFFFFFPSYSRLRLFLAPCFFFSFFWLTRSRCQTFREHNCCRNRNIFIGSHRAGMHSRTDPLSSSSFVSLTCPLYRFSSASLVRPRFFPIGRTISVRYRPLHIAHCINPIISACIHRTTIRAQRSRENE